MGQYYQNTPSASREITEQKPLTLSEQFLARARAKAAAGEAFEHWVRAAGIAKRIEAGLPVGRARRRSKSKNKTRSQCPRFIRAGGVAVHVGRRAA